MEQPLTAQNCNYTILQISGTQTAEVIDGIIYSGKNRLFLAVHVADLPFSRTANTFLIKVMFTVSGSATDSPSVEAKKKHA